MRLSSILGGSASRLDVKRHDGSAFSFVILGSSQVFVHNVLDSGAERIAR